MLRRLVKLALSAVVWAWDRLAESAASLSGRAPKPRLVILYYHAVPDAHRALFERQMKSVASIATPVPLPPGGLPTPRALQIAITFDDGFESVVRNAMPVLRRYGIPITIFFPTGSWGSRPSWVVDPRHPSYVERVLDRDELRAFAADPLVTVGSHSITHPRFPSLAPEKAMHEFVQSKTDLETVLGRPVELFSFPHGAHDATALDRARQAGYRQVYTVNPERLSPATQAFALGRIAVDPDDWPLEFALKIRGAYRWCAAPPIS